MRGSEWGRDGHEEEGNYRKIEDLRGQMKRPKSVIRGRASPLNERNFGSRFTTPHIPFPSQIGAPFPAFSTLFKLGSVSSSFSPSPSLPHPSRITHRGQEFPWRKERKSKPERKEEKLLRSQKPISMTDCPDCLTDSHPDYAHSQQEFGSSRSHAISYLSDDDVDVRPWKEQETLAARWERERCLPARYPGLRELRPKNTVKNNTLNMFYKRFSSMDASLFLGSVSYSDLSNSK